MNHFSYNRRISREVKVGNIIIGGNHPIRVQSMTNTPTLDTKKTVKQIVKLYEAGSELVRLTVEDEKTAYNLLNIQNELKKHKINVPLIADIHFNYKAALIACDYVQKIRINPGNLVAWEEDKLNPESELKKITERISPLIEKLKKNNIAVRIGVNHGSLSRRILERYGNTVKGMVVSAIEYIDIFSALNYHDIVLSMKSSIPQVMIEAYRNLADIIDKKNLNYPLHLGVTEAGEGISARIKSSFGVGALLLEGIGDTIRFSLTEPPEKEIPVAKKLVKRIELMSSILRSSNSHPEQNTANQTTRLNNSFTVGNYKSPPLVGVYLNKIKLNDVNSKLEISEADFLVLSDKLKLKDYKSISVNKKLFNEINLKKLSENNIQTDNNILTLDLRHSFDLFVLKEYPQVKILLTAPTRNYFYDIKKFLRNFNEQKLKNDIYLLYRSSMPIMNTVLFSSCDLGSLLVSELIKGIIISNPKIKTNSLLNICFEILQATRLKITKTEYISCPTCGRTQFNLVEATKKIKEATSHLPGLKIAIMGCIVNGPGEMADADYGYVGSANGKVTLFKGKNIAGRNILPEDSLKELINIIKSDGRWKEKT
ncbi:MAG: hypothetical protein ACD_79C00585G0008 [uncultured bacterium]|nr:MAG: hypothetical protein ACD_79C00585G0008 [uncultured bacterium]